MTALISNERAAGLIRGQRYAVLATSQDDVAYACLVAVAVSGDLHCLYFATLADTRTGRTLAANPTAALLMDDRRNASDDLEAAAALTVTGVARVLEGAARDAAARVYLRVHPRLGAFLSTPGCCMYRLDIGGWHLSTRFVNSVPPAS